MSDGIGLAEALLGLEGFRVLAVVESTDELVITIETIAELSYEIIVWIEHTYNRRRRQHVLGKLTPVAYELALTPPPCSEDNELAA